MQLRNFVHSISYQSSHLLCRCRSCAQIVK